MKTISRRIWAVALTLVMVLALALPAGAAEDREASARQAVEAAMTYGGAISAQYALWEDGEITLSGTMGVYSKTENRALTDDNLYGIGSVSKMYTAAATMALVEDGKVDLDKPVTTYLPQFTMADSRYKDITVRMLLNHSSGLMGTTNLDAFLLDDGDNESAVDGLLDQLKTQTLQADPGAYSVYCNDGFTLAQLVIEAVSGQPFEQFIRQEFLEPLGLKATFAPQDDFDRSLLAKTYIGTETRALPPETLAIVGTGGLYASASDLAAFGGALTGTEILSEASTTAMAQNEGAKGLWPEDSEGSLLSYGLGWDAVELYPFSANEIQALAKGGDTLVYHAGLVVLPEYNMAAAVLTSGGVSTYNEMAAAQLLIDALAEQGVTVDASATLPTSAEAAMPKEMMDYAGSYGAAATLADVALTEDGVMTLTVAGQEQGTTLTYRENGTFQDATNSVAVRLVDGGNGQVYFQQLSYMALPGLPSFYSAEYALGKLPANQVDESTAAAWAAREGKGYVQVNETYTSALYPFSSVFAAVSFVGSPEGYLAINKLQDANTAVPVLQIPGTGSRDSGVIRMYEEDGVEYMEISGSIYRDFSSYGEIYAGPASLCTIQSDGYARWYTVGTDAAGKTMTVSVPENGGFYVYDAALQMVASSHVYGDTQVVLPQDGCIVFAGDAGAQFRVTMG